MMGAKSMVPPLPFAHKGVKREALSGKYRLYNLKYKELMVSEICETLILSGCL